MYGGFSYGAAIMCDYLYSPVSGMWISHLDPYLPLSNSSIYFLWPMLTFFFLKLFERGWVTSLIILLPLIAALLVWSNRAMILNGFIDDPDKYFNVLRELTEVPWIVFGLLIATILVQAAVVGLKLYNTRTKIDVS